MTVAGIMVVREADGAGVCSQALVRSTTVAMDLAMCQGPRLRA